ncbi:MAG TPA: hypothetical protein DC058_11625, partial [Planctomycetaceae bacterium]|nr:hypothetical protein [Planctomycetaceae bacterium]
GYPGRVCVQKSVSRGIRSRRGLSSAEKSIARDLRQLCGGEESEFAGSSASSGSGRQQARPSSSRWLVVRWTGICEGLLRGVISVGQTMGSALPV